MKQKTETSKTLRKLNKTQIQAVLDKEKEIKRLAAIIEKESEKRKSRTNEITSHKTPS